jgi:NitT/TauT family transport system substrate-binding protein
LAVLGVCFCIGCGSTASSRQSKPVEVRISVTRAPLNYMPVYVAGPSGCFAREGIQVLLDETSGSVKSLQALEGGSVDVAATDYLVMLDLVRDAQPLREFVLLSKLPGLVVIASPKASRPIRNLQDLKGRTVGVTTPGTAYHRLFNHILQIHGVNPDEVSVVGVGPGMSFVSSLERGVVDAGLVSAFTTSYLLRRYPTLTILVDTRTPESTRAALGRDEVAFNVLCAREAWLRANPQTARKLASSMQCGLAWVRDHTPQQIRGVLPESGRSPDAEADFEAISSAKVSFTLDGQMTPEAHAAAVRFLTTPNTAQAKNQEPYTNEFLKP